MDEWEKHTCLKFRPKNSGDTNYIQILDGEGYIQDGDRQTDDNFRTFFSQKYVTWSDFLFNIAVLGFCNDGTVIVHTRDDPVFTFVYMYYLSD